MRRSRDELVTDIAKMVELRNQNKTYRQIAQIMGYKSPGTVSDLLRKRGHLSVVFSQLEVNYIITTLKSKPENRLIGGILGKLTKLGGK